MAIARSISGAGAQDRIEIGLGADLDAEIVDVAIAAAERGREFLEHPEAEILEHRDDFGQRNQAAAAIGLEAQLPGRVVIEPRDSDRAVIVVGEVGQAQDIRGAFLGRGARAIAVGEGVDVGQREAGRARHASRVDQLGFDRRAPSREPSRPPPHRAPAASGIAAFSSIYCV